MNLGVLLGTIAGSVAALWATLHFGLGALASWTKRRSASTAVKQQARADEVLERVLGRLETTDLIPVVRDGERLAAHGVHPGGRGCSPDAAPPAGLCATGYTFPTAPRPDPALHQRVDAVASRVDGRAASRRSPHEDAPPAGAGTRRPGKHRLTSAAPS